MKKRKLLITFLFLLVCITLMAVNIAATSFDNIKSFDKDYGNYGKVHIKDWFGLQDLAELELKENTNNCLRDCSAEAEIIMYQDGALIDEVRFMTLGDGESWTEQPIISYEFFVEVGEEEMLEMEKKEQHAASKEGKEEKLQEWQEWSKPGGRWLRNMRRQTR